jgi:mRNA-degrading endonuclease RelE of RelBE toxin-antitoxin system
LNLYTYCQEDPVDNWDPDGHDGVGTLSKIVGVGSETFNGATTILAAINAILDNNSHVLGHDDFKNRAAYEKALKNSQTKKGAIQTKKSTSKGTKKTTVKKSATTKGNSTAKTNNKNSGNNGNKDNKDDNKNGKDNKDSKENKGDDDKVKVNVPKSVGRQVKKLSPEAKKGYDNAIEALENGDTRGLNDHPLSDNRAGQRAIDIKGTGKGRGAGRIVYTVDSDGKINIIEILTDHRY